LSPIQVPGSMVTSTCDSCTAKARYVGWVLT
jgi:hypothetical protein